MAWLCPCSLMRWLVICLFVLSCCATPMTMNHKNEASRSGLGVGVSFFPCAELGRMKPTGERRHSVHSANQAKGRGMISRGAVDQPDFVHSLPTWTEARRNSPCNCSGYVNGSKTVPVDLCTPVNVSTTREEVLVWYVPGDLQTWQHYDWSKVTTVAVLDDIHKPVPQDLLCYAHAHKVRVVYVIQYGCWADGCPWLQNKTVRSDLVRALAAKVESEKLDGVNIDIEGLTNYQQEFTELVSSMTKSVRSVCATCQLSIDMPYIPQPVESFTGYNWSGLAGIVDFLITMNYDMNDYGMHGGFADANSPLPPIQQAMHCILLLTYDQHVPANKIVMGFPWYAYYFRCDNSTPLPGPTPVGEVKNPCYSHLPFTESSSQHSLADAILNKLPISSTGRLWDSESQAPYFDFMNGTMRHRVRYDDNQSIAVRCNYAKSLAVRGVAFWTANVDYGVPMPESHEKLEEAMWDSVVWPTR